ncbi:two-component regulator propeller domain-containing protein [Psychroserpens mesophilus]|uniref:type IX secretion system anionic LPS delivery protein PorZ n=1 Tax=Psychroserpens mesophilus TaxID=325473 RepID=UPI0005905B1C|nr:two-component regulator propeller domain-containing protein [Psychroserpens mesophilus]
MKRILLVLLSLSYALFANAQDFSSLWEGHFSYLNISDFSASEDVLYAASENAVFTFDYNTNEINTISTVDGLSGDNISSIYYSEANDILVIGYDTGLIDIVLNDNEVLVVIDILNKVTIPPDKKNINHFYEHEGLLYISTDYGISVYDLERLEFGDTYFIGSGGSQIRVTQTTVVDGFVYAACRDNTGIKRGDISNPNLIDFNQWETIRAGNFVAIESIGDKVYAISINKAVFEILENPFTQLFQYPLLPVDMRSNDSRLIITTEDVVYIYDVFFNLISTVTNNSDLGVLFTVASLNNQDEIFVGTSGIINDGKSGRGVIKTTFSSPDVFEEIHPDGPLSNNVFAIENSPNNLWAVFGGYSRTFNPSGGIRRSGVSRFVNEEWRNIEYDTIESLIEDPFFLSDIAINPFNTEQIFITSHWSGVIEFNNETPIILYNEDNSTLDPFTSNVQFVTVNIFDKNGALWVMNCRTPRPLNKFENGQWTSYDFTSIIPVPPTNSNIGFSSLVIDDLNNKFTGAFSFGLVGFNENGGNEQLSFANGEAENFPSSFVKTLALDNNGQLWIGTEKGLRVLFSPANFFTNSVVNNIVILEEGIPKELLSNQLITSIAVDGSNNKWIGTADSGLFYFSPDGQQTIFHFTKDNSPLPTNNINEVSIDPSSGIVYIATPNGLLSFSSGGTKPEETLDQAFVYPNPVRPEYNILGSNNLNDINNGVKISNLTENVNIKITDIEGNLVAEAQSRVNQRTSSANYNFAIDGGTAIWNGKNLANNVVATGVYLIFISDLDSFETKILKLLIVR